MILKSHLAQSFFAAALFTAAAPTLAQNAESQNRTHYQGLTDKCTGTVMEANGPSSGLVTTQRNIPLVGIFPVIVDDNNHKTTICVSPEKILDGIQEWQQRVDQYGGETAYKETLNQYLMFANMAFKNLSKGEQTDERKEALIKEAEETARQDATESELRITSVIDSLRESVHAMREFESNSGKKSGPGIQPITLPDVNLAGFSGLTLTCDGPAYLPDPAKNALTYHGDVVAENSGLFSRFTISGKDKQVTFCLEKSALQDAVTFWEKNRDGFAKHDVQELQLHHQRASIQKMKALNSDNPTSEQVKAIQTEEQTLLKEAIVEKAKQRENNNLRYHEALRAMLVK